MKYKTHIPGRAFTPEPKKLVSIAGKISHPNIVKSGITTTSKGDWALLVTVRRDTPVPIKEVEKKCGAFPIIYQEDSGRMLVARPAYPQLGE
jgi:hypothetical protein